MMGRGSRMRHASGPVILALIMPCLLAAPLKAQSLTTVELEGVVLTGAVNYSGIPPFRHYL